MFDYCIYSCIDFDFYFVTSFLICNVLACLAVDEVCLHY